MNIVQQITADALQKQTLILADGSSLSLTLYFRPMQFGWYIQNITYGTFQINGMRITTSPNMLNQYRNQIPFGIACYTDQNREPTQQQDFSSGAAKLYILSQAECTQYAELLSGNT